MIKLGKKVKFSPATRVALIIFFSFIFLIVINVSIIAAEHASGIFDYPAPTPIPNQSTIPTPTLAATPTPTILYKPKVTPTNNSSSLNANDEWGVAKQVSEHTWTMKVGYDERMATPQEILDALNHYRQEHGSGYLAWDNNLGNYAQSRADYFNQIKGIDEHKGFNDYVSNIDNLRQLNFYHVGENSSYGYRLLGVHIIEWMYAGDKPHNDNQLNPSWTHVGIGVSGTATDLIFGE